MASIVDDEMSEFVAVCRRLAYDRLAYDDVVSVGDFSRDTGFHVESVGGGFVAVPPDDDALRELHVFPHSGIVLPSHILARYEESMVAPLAELVLMNADSGTGYLARGIGARVLASTEPSAGLAV